MHGGQLAVLQEVGILKGLNYDRNVIQFYGACLQPGRDPMLICEYMEGGSFEQLYIRMSWSPSYTVWTTVTSNALHWQSTKIEDVGYLIDRWGPVPGAET